MPAAYATRQAAKQQVQEQREAAHAARQRTDREAQEANRQAVERERESGQLDRHFAALDAQTRQAIEAEAVQRLGILGKMGRAQGALVAMRRNVLRERLDGEVAASGRPAGTVVG